VYSGLRFDGEAFCFYGSVIFLLSFFFFVEKTRFFEGSCCCEASAFICCAAGGVVLDRKWHSTGVCCWCYPSWLCHKALILLLHMARGERHTPQQVAVMPYSILFNYCRAKVIAGIVGTAARGPALLKAELDSSLTGPCIL
ncbi:hypothetical protein XENORESO_012528, partial [Xenotaenia resolanae]